MNRHLVAAFLVTGLIVGLLVSWQFNTRVPLPTNFPSDQVEAKELLLKEYLDEQSYLQSRIVTLREQIDANQAVVDEHSDAASVALLDELKENIGLVEVSGRGIEILLDDSVAALREGAEASDSLLIQASDVRDIINLLFAAKAEGISVNQQRIIANSPISSVGTSILINNAHVAPPFVISAVGDRELMLQRMLDGNLLFGFSDRVNKDGIVFQVESKEKLLIPIYNGDLKHNYLNLVE